MKKVVILVLYIAFYLFNLNIVLSQHEIINDIIVQFKHEPLGQYDSQNALVKVKSMVPDVEFYLCPEPLEYDTIKQYIDKIGNAYFHIEEGKYDIAIKAKDQKQMKFNTLIVPNQEFRGGWVYSAYISIKPPRNFGILLIESTPIGSKVRITSNDIEDSLITPSIKILPSGNVNLKFFHPNYPCIVKEKDLTVKDYNKDGWSYVKIEFDTLKSFISIRVLPTEASAAFIYLNNKKIGNAPFHGKLKVGTYNINLVQEKYKLISPLKIEVDPCKELNEFNLTMEKWGELNINLEDCNLKVSEIHLNERKIGTPPLRIQLPPDSTYMIKLYDESSKPFGKIVLIEIPLSKIIPLTKTDFDLIECKKERWYKKNINQIIGSSIFAVALGYTVYELVTIDNQPKKIPSPPDFPK